MRRPTMRTDPAGTVGSVGAFVGAVLTALVAFGVELTAEQIEAVLGIVATGGPLALAVLIRRSAWSPDAHDRAVRMIRDHRPDRAEESDL